MLAWIITGIVTFAATNVDDILVLVMFFSQVNTSFRPHHVVLGQYLGFTTLVGVSLFGFLVSLVIPRPWIGLLGFVPLWMGLRQLWPPHQVRASGAVKHPTSPLSTPSRFRHFLDPQIFKVTTVTIANGGDNIGIYTPLFASSSVGRLSILLVVFFTLVGIWCLIGYGLTRQPIVAMTMTRYGHILVPFVLIGLGVLILLESDTLSLISGVFPDRSAP
jgi:cadmium resistance transport/sequestration family protein